MKIPQTNIKEVFRDLKIEVGKLKSQRMNQAKVMGTIELKRGFVICLSRRGEEKKRRTPPLIQGIWCTRPRFFFLKSKNYYFFKFLF